MYIAPLNYDRFFKKVFSDINIAKHFLEDFFDVTIEEIYPLPTRHKITDDAKAVEFDFRCKIDEHYVIIDMQQWYKTDIVKRFYLYHCLNTGLQAQDIPLKSIAMVQGKQRETKDYNQLEPVFTLIWLADENLGVDLDYLGYTLTPELLTDFVRQEYLWQNEDLNELQKKRSELLALLSNNTRQLNFLQQNRMIFALQGNIVKNKKYRRYLRWFQFAEKSRDKNNRREDFEEYAKDEVFTEIIRRLNRDTLNEGDLKYIEDYEKVAAQFKLHEKTIWDNARKDGLAEGKAEGKAEAAKNCLLEGMSIELSAKISGLPVEQVKEMARQLGLLH